MGRAAFDRGIANSGSRSAKRGPITADEPHRDTLQGCPTLQHVGCITIYRKEKAVREAPDSYEWVDHRGFNCFIAQTIMLTDEAPDFRLGGLGF